MNFAIVGRRGRVTLPSKLRKQIGLYEGDRIAFLVEGGQLVIRPLTRTRLDLRGSVPVAGAQDFDAIRNEVIARRAGRAAAAHTDDD